MATKTAEYFVRPNLQVHRVVTEKRRGKTVTTTKLYQGGDKIENLEGQEFKKYQHLIETAEQIKAREGK